MIIMLFMAKSLNDYQKEFSSSFTKTDEYYV